MKWSRFMAHEGTPEDRLRYANLYDIQENGAGAARAPTKREREKSIHSSLHECAATPPPLPAPPPHHATAATPLLPIPLRRVSTSNDAPLQDDISLTEVRPLCAALTVVAMEGGWGMGSGRVVAPPPAPLPSLLAGRTPGGDAARCR